MRHNIKNDSHFPHYQKVKIKVVRAQIGCWCVEFFPKKFPAYFTELAAFASRKEAREYAHQVRCALRGN